MDDEREGIKPAHREMFQWVFGPSDGMTQQTKELAHWLREDSGIFFVSGKAGSGKSTADLRESLARVMNIYHTRRKAQGLCCEDGGDYEKSMARIERRFELGGTDETNHSKPCKC
jgi:predicted ATPase